MSLRRWLLVWSDSAMTWPNLTVQVHLLPWSWHLLPRGWYDYSPRDGDRAGWFGLYGRWLMVNVDFGFNLPPFTWEKPIEEDT